MKILFITFGLPYPPDSGVRIHDFYLVKNISQHHSVLVLSLLTSREQVKHIQGLRQYCDYVDFVLEKPHSIRQHFSRIIRSLLKGRPLATYPFIYGEMLSKIREIVTKWDVDIIQIEHSFFAPYVEAISTNGKCKKVLSFHNLGAIQYKRMMGLRTGFTQKSLLLKMGLIQNFTSPLNMFLKTTTYCLLESWDTLRMLMGFCIFVRI